MGGYEMYLTATIQENPTPQPELFQLFEEEPGGSRPPCLGELWGPQERVQLRVVEQLADVVPMVQILDIPGPQGWDQLVASLLHFDTPIPEQVTEVPKISSSSRCGCFFLVAGRRAWYRRVRLSGLPSYLEASRAAACGG